MPILANEEKYRTKCSSQRLEGSNGPQPHVWSESDHGDQSSETVGLFLQNEHLLYIESVLGEIKWIVLTLRGLACKGGPPKGS